MDAGYRPRLNEMVARLRQLPGPDRGRRLAAALAVLLALGAAVLAPVLELGLQSDDFVWWAFARQAREESALLLAPHGGYRPLNTWLFAFDQLVFGADPAGYHAQVLVLHLAAGALFALLAFRFGWAALASSALGLLWLISPFTFEPVQALSTQHYPVLWLAWLALLLAWPRSGAPWRLRHSAAAAGVTLVTALTIETWVVLPALAVAADRWLGGRRGWAAAVRGALLGVAPLIYVAIYFLGTPPASSAAYFARDLVPTARLLHAWAAFLYLTPLEVRPAAPGAPEWLAAATIAAVAWTGIRLRAPAVGIGLALYFLPFLPVLLVPYLPTRYTYIPYAGFLLALAALYAAARSRWPAGARRTADAGAAGLVLLLLVANASSLRADLRDARRLSGLYDGLLSAARVLPGLAGAAEIVVAVRLEGHNLLHDIATEGVQKSFFVRARGPYGLIDWPALLTCAGGPDGAVWREAASTPGLARESRYAVIGHTRQGFLRLPPAAVTVGEEAAAWAARSPAVTLLRRVHPARRVSEKP